MIRFNLVNRLKSLRANLKNEVFDRNHMLDQKVDQLSADLYTLKEFYSKYDMDAVLEFKDEQLESLYSEITSILHPICKRWYNFAPKTIEALNQLCEKTLYIQKEKA